MFRGSAKLLSRSVRCFVPVLEAIVEAPPEIWDIDVDSYGPRCNTVVLDIAESIRRTLPGRASDTLVTKIMLGVYGCVPALDSYFRRGFGASRLGPKALRSVAAFYASNAEVIERHRVFTWDFDTSAPTDRRYTRAKVIDMIFFIEGDRRPTTAEPDSDTMDP
jgi:hypothetical protein